MHYVFDFSAIFQGEYPVWLLRGLVTTLALAGLAWILAFVVGSLLAVIRLTGSPTANALISVYVAFHRNVPMLVLILFWYFGVPALLPQGIADWLNEHGSEFILSCIAIGLVMSAYVCEDLRSAVRAIPAGQVEASRALGLSFLRTMRCVVLPQAFRIAIPPLLNQTLLLLKNTSLAMAVGVTELTAVALEIENNTFRTFEAYAMVTVIYLLLSFLIMAGGALLQRRYRPLGGH
ncbi:ABC transporter permease [Bordetella trematum]|uniref:Amino acids ABC transporter permease n=1 Tax=Bordetella trematum TaxID=123899 RepID=A0A157SJS4_9BORD|nr:amino acid ABC transporter permease [Bordetella trematum]AUL46488.1 ABC transporter permease [Bordetella trematum]AZR93283.1 ABC transporter permease [Bordetella trematum]NNH20597.1 amino acid ABC transporter permease [Bordetella trematum]QIM71861.1 amino acid ABC transporter permease [Bordetella trematum]SAI20720.1 amino acids ABC transporter permease [Bordetella trematum]